MARCHYSTAPRRPHPRAARRQARLAVEVGWAAATEVGARWAGRADELKAALTSAAREASMPMHLLLNEVRRYAGCRQDLAEAKESVSLEAFLSPLWCRATDSEASRDEYGARL